MKVRVEYLDGRVKVMSEAEWGKLKAKGEDWLADNVASADLAEE